MKLAIRNYYYLSFCRFFDRYLFKSKQVHIGGRFSVFFRYSSRRFNALRYVHTVLGLLVLEYKSRDNSLSAKKMSAFLSRINTDISRFSPFIPPNFCLQFILYFNSWSYRELSILCQCFSITKLT